MLGVIKTLAREGKKVGGWRARPESTQSSCGNVVYFVFVMLVKQFAHAKGAARDVGSEELDLGLCCLTIFRF